jgi:hypothetical protein
MRPPTSGITIRPGANLSGAILAAKTVGGGSTIGLVQVYIPQNWRHRSFRLAQCCRDNPAFAPPDMLIAANKATRQDVRRGGDLGQTPSHQRSFEGDVGSYEPGHGR